MNSVLEIYEKAILGEGPYWDHDERKLYWVDILRNSLHIFDPLTKKSNRLEFPNHVCAIAKKGTDELILALKDGIYFYNLKTGELTIAAKPNHELDDENRFNDGKCDPQGRFWVGTMNMNGKKHQGELFCFLRDGTLQTVLKGVSISNGMAWDETRNKMYYIDTPTQQIVSYDFDYATGEISNKDTVYTFDLNDGSPDGMTIDSQGMLWVALWGGGKVANVDPLTKEWLSSIEVPASLVTSCVFGGENLQTLYITTARIGLSEEELAVQPFAGGVFSIQLDVKGTPCNSF
jgi:sugar lactone lactonase YvrE